VSNIRCVYLNGITGKTIPRPDWDKHKSDWLEAYAYGYAEDGRRKLLRSEEEIRQKFNDYYPYTKALDKFEMWLQRASTEFKDDYFMFITQPSQEDHMANQIAKYGLQDQLVYKSRTVHNKTHPGSGRRITMYIFKFNKEFRFE
jgi:hypothetical protein